MKVLWFTNTSSSANEYIGKSKSEVTGSWIKNLEKYLREKNNIELSIAFQYPVKEIQKFKNGWYYLIPQYKIPKWLRPLAGRRIEAKKHIRHYLKIINDFQPDLIHIFGTENSYGLIINHINVPVVISIQGILSMIIKKWFAGISRSDILKYSPLKDFLLATDYLSCYERATKLSKREKNVLNRCSFVIGRTKWDKRIISIMSPKTRYFHNDEILREDFFKVSWNICDNKEIKLLSIMRDNIYKGLEVIVETAILLHSVNTGFAWTIIGLSKKNPIVRIIQKKYSVNLDSVNITLAENKSSKEITEYMLSSDIFVHSSHIENSSNSICEAMAVGIPVIATHAGGISSLIDTNRNGILIQDGDSYELAGTITELYNNKTLMLKLSINARQRAKKRHNPEKIVNELLEIYEKIILSEQRIE